MTQGDTKHFFLVSVVMYFFFFNDTATTEIYTLSLHDALPISKDPLAQPLSRGMSRIDGGDRVHCGDRKSTRLNSSHSQISYAVFCLKKKEALAEFKQAVQGLPNNLDVITAIALIRRRHMLLDH